MAESELSAALRVITAGGEPPAWLLAELSLVTHRFTRFASLPASVSPTGSWDDEAAEELFQGWMEGRLLRGGLLALLHRATSRASLRALAERSLRQWLLNQRQRSQSQNLYVRMQTLLRDSAQFEIAQTAARPQDVLWRLAEQAHATPFAGGERELASAAWGLGAFELIRYSGGQQRLAPVLSSPDLERFIHGMLRDCGALTNGQLLTALRARWALEEPQLLQLEAIEEPAGIGADPADVITEQAAWAVIGEMTARQADVLLGKRAGETLQQLAHHNECSVATVDNELRRIAAIILRLVDDEQERDQLTVAVGDLLFEHANADGPSG